MVLNILLPFFNFYDKHSDFQKQVNMYIYNWITLLYNWNNIQSKQTLCNPMDLAHQTPLSMKFSEREYWSGLPFPSSGDLPDPGIKPRSPAMQAASLLSEPPGKPK